MDTLSKLQENGTVRAIVLDMDGLMIDTEPLYKRSMQQTARKLGYDLSDEFMLSLVGRQDSDCRRLIASRFGDGFPQDAFWSGWPKIWRQIASTEGIARKPGLEELLSFLSETRLPAALATSTYREQAEFSLSAASVEYPFVHMVTGDQIGHGKPAPDIFLEAARRLGISPQHCVALEDSENGIRSAAAAGMTAIMVPDLIPPSDEIRRLANHVLESLHDVRAFLAKMELGPA